MGITFHQEQQFFHLRNQQISYIIGLEKDKYLTHRYFGPSLASYHGSNQLQLIDRGFSTNPISDERTFSLNTLPLETSTVGSLDYRIPNYLIRNQQGHQVTAFEYDSHQILADKPALAGLPSLRGDHTTTLMITLKDQIQQLTMQLFYTIYAELPVITRSVRFLNNSQQTVYLENAGSLMLDLTRNDFDLITLNGAHTNEANISRQGLHPGIQRIDSNRGTSSPQHQPFLALADKTTNEVQGAVYGFHLLYSGNFVAQVEVEQYGSSRLQMGINPDTFTWKLTPGESFDTPEAVINFSQTGFNGLSQNFHKLYQSHLVPQYWTDKARPILLNTWEGSYFDFTEADLLRQAKIASEMGIELFVLDDGWFGQRNDDTSSLGDWQVNPAKLPHGLPWLSKQIHQLGMQFGLWFEPEMLSQNSQLFRQHPDWALQVPDYPLTEGRQQLVLDLSKTEVQDFLIDMLRGHLTTGGIDYIEWDMNRHLTEVGNQQLSSDQQGEVSHRYVLGLYRILETITGEFPEVLFENCSSGGGRFDPGMMAYMPQTWTSDNSDAICRTQIQNGYSLLYPPIMMGAHVSDVPNHQVGRITPLETRGAVAMAGNFGYEVAIERQTDEELAAMRQQIDFYKKHRQLLQFGRFYRLGQPNGPESCAWLITNDQQALLIYSHGLARPAQQVNYLKLAYLDEQALYQNTTTQEIFSGSELNHAGLLIPRIKGDFHSLMILFDKIEADTSNE